MYNYHFLGMHLFWWFMWIFIIFVFFFLDFSPHKKKDNPLRILKRRLASGEITIEEYNQCLAVLTGKEISTEVY